MIRQKKRDFGKKLGDTAATAAEEGVGRWELGGGRRFFPNGAKNGGLAEKTRLNEGQWQLATVDPTLICIIWCAW